MLLGRNTQRTRCNDGTILGKLGIMLLKERIELIPQIRVTLRIAPFPLIPASLQMSG